MKQHAFCFRFETTKEHSNQNKKNQLKQIQNQNFKFNFSNSFKNYIWNFLISRFTLDAKSPIYMGTFVLRTLPYPRTPVRFCPRTFVSFTH